MLDLANVDLEVRFRKDLWSFATRIVIDTDRNDNNRPTTRANAVYGDKLVVISMSEPTNVNWEKVRDQETRDKLLTSINDCLDYTITFVEGLAI